MFILTKRNGVEVRFSFYSCHELFNLQPILLTDLNYLLKPHMIKLTRTLACLLFFLLEHSWVFSQNNGPRLIVRGDDMGFAHSGNLGLVETYKNGIETSIEVIVPAPWFPEAVKMLQENPGVDVGIHLALTSEWDNVKYRPVSHCPSIVDEDGYFYPFIWPNNSYPAQAIKDHYWNLSDIEREFRAQIELAKRHIPHISHISGHMGSTGFDPRVRALSDRLAKEYGLDIDPGKMGVKSVSYNGPHGTSKEKISSFITMLKSLKKGETYLFVDHPALDSPELKAIWHKGYENVAADRQGVVDTWVSEEVKRVISEQNIQLISYADLLQDREVLFNGKNHAGWYTDVPAMDRDSSMKTPFIIRDNKMVSLAHTGGHIITEKEFENFRLDLDYRFAAKPGNCGILVHASKPRRLYGMFPQSVEVQLMHTNAGDFWCIGEDIVVPDMVKRRGPKETWGVDGENNRRVVNLTDNSERPVGEWNHARVECLGKEIKVWINGELVNHGFNATVSRGKIALQAEGSEVEFRDITVSSISALSED